MKRISLTLNTMRKVFLFVCLAVMVVSFTGCPPDPPDKDTTYTFKDDFDSSGTTWEAFIFEYNDAGEVVMQQQSFVTSKGLKRVFVANKRATKVKIKYKIRAGSTEAIMWVRQVFYLEKEKNIDINLNGQTILVLQEP